MDSKATNVRDMVVTRTPPVLRALGVDDLPITISRDVARKASNGVMHSVGRDALRALPEELADPVAVFDSDTKPGDALVVLTETKDANGDPVIVALDIRKRGSTYEVNRIASAYGKSAAESNFTKWIASGRLRYRSERAQENAGLKRLYLPASNPRPDGLDGKVLREADIVNSTNATDQQAFSRGTEATELNVDPGFVAGLSAKERKSPTMTAFAQAMYAEHTSGHR